MTIDYFRRMFSYNDWANDAFVVTARGLTEEQFTRHIPSSFPTIRDTLGHMAFAEWLWLQRWRGENPTSRPDWTKEPSLDGIAMQFRSASEGRTALLETLTDEDVRSELAYRNLAGEPLAAIFGELMAHVVNHGTYHRGQLTTMLRQLEVKPPATDLVNIFASSRK